MKWTRRFSYGVALGVLACSHVAKGPETSPRAPAASEAKSGVPARDPKVFTKPSGLVPLAVTSFGAAATATHLYTLGGYFGKAHEYDRSGQSDRFARMDLKTGLWEDLPSPGPLQSTTLVAYQDRIYRIGGMRIDNAPSEPTDLSSLSDFAVYDPTNAEWQLLPSLPSPRSSHEAVLLGSKVYVVGGWQVARDGKSGSWHTSLAIADLATNPIQWREAPAPFKARALGLTAWGDRIAIVGGITAEKTVSKEVHLYDPATRTWSRGPDYPEAGFGVRAAALGERIYATGASGVVFELAHGGERWRAVSKLLFPRVFHQIVATNDHDALVIGGIPGMSGQDRVRQIESIVLDEQPAAVTSFTIENPSKAKNRQGLLWEDGELYVFGGNNSLGQHDFAENNFVAEGYSLDLGALKWSKARPFPLAQQSMQTIETSGDLSYAIGGFGMTKGKLTTSPDVYLYSASGWRKAKKGLPESRTQFGVTEHDGKLWLFGGLNFGESKPSDPSFNHLTEVLSHDLSDPDSGFVDSGVVLPRMRRAFAGAQLGNKYYLVGGMAESFGMVDPVDVWNFETHAWESVPPPKEARIGAEMAALNGKLYLVAGRSKQADGKLGPSFSIECFDPTTNQWTVALERLPMAETHQLRVTPFNDRLLIYTAYREDDQVQLVLFDPRN